MKQKINSNARELGEFLKVSHVTIYKWVKLGMPYSLKKRGNNQVMMFETSRCVNWGYSNIKGFKVDTNPCKFCESTLIDLGPIIEHGLTNLNVMVSRNRKTLLLKVTEKDSNTIACEYKKSYYNLSIKYCPMCGDKLTSKVRR